MVGSRVGVTSTMLSWLLSLSVKDSFARTGPNGEQVEDIYCEYTVCPRECGYPCNCYDAEMSLGCGYCHDGFGCIECQDTHFMYSYNTYCADCTDTCGESCLYCGDGNGCQSCDGYTSLVYDTKCGIFVCKDHCESGGGGGNTYPVPNPTASPNDPPVYIPDPTKSPADPPVYYAEPTQSPNDPPVYIPEPTQAPNDPPVYIPNPTQSPNDPPVYIANPTESPNDPPVYYADPTQTPTKFVYEPSPQPQCGNTPVPIPPRNPLPTGHPTPPTGEPTVDPTNEPSDHPTVEPTPQPGECKRHRKAWHKLTNEERMLYINGFLYLHNNGQIPYLLSLTHVNGFNALQAHRGSGFLPWHRYFLWEIETLIRNIGEEYKCFSMPYWDWGHDALNVGDSIIYSSGLSKGSPGVGECVDDNYFDENSYGTPINCLVRNPFTVAQLFSTGFKTSPQLLVDIVDWPNYADYRGVLESSHDRPHGRVGGNMVTFRSPDDPIFYLHHAYIDFNWAVWQDCHDYDLIANTDLDGNDAAFFAFDNQIGASEVLLDSPLRFDTLLGGGWGNIDDLGFIPTIRHMHDITDWNVIYDVGDFWDEAGVENEDYCQGKMNPKWFTGTSLFNEGGAVSVASDFSSFADATDVEVFTDGGSGSGSGSRAGMTAYVAEDGYSYDMSQCENGDYIFQPCPSATYVQGYGAYADYGVCQCDELDYSTCNSCSQYNGCGECKDGYFKKTDGHNCVSCSDVVGYGCEVCSDYVGCAVCYNGFHLVYDSNCDLWKCERIQEPCAKEYLYGKRQYLKSRDDLTKCEKRAYMNQMACEYSNRNLLDRGIITEVCTVPADFEGCDGMTEDEASYLTLDELKAKGGVRDTPCLQEIRDYMYDWLKINGRLLQLCNGEYDPQC